MSDDARTWTIGFALVLVTAVGCGSEETAITGEPFRAPDGSGAMTTKASGGSLEVGSDGLDFGTVRCGAEASPQTIMLKNTGSVPLTYDVGLTEGAPVRVDRNGPTTIAAGETQSIVVSSRGSAIGESLGQVLVSIGGDLVKAVPVKVTGTGARLEFSTLEAEFGDVRYSAGGSVDVVLKNTGTESASLTGFTGEANGFDVGWPGKPEALVVPPNAEKTLHITLDSTEPTSGRLDKPLAAALTPVFAEAVCGEIPKVAASGRLVNHDVTVSPVNFGRQKCRSSPTVTQGAEIVNYSSGTLTVRARGLPVDSQFAYAGASTTTVAPGTSLAPTKGNVALKLNPLGGLTAAPAFPPIRQSITFDITSSDPSFAPLTVTKEARVDVTGAFISSTGNVSLTSECLNGFVCTGGSCSFSTRCTEEATDLTFRNAGNAPVHLRWTLSPAIRGWTIPTSAQTLGPASTTIVHVGFNPSGNPSATVSTVRLDAVGVGDTLCNPGGLATTILTGVAIHSR